MINKNAIQLLMTLNQSLASASHSESHIQFVAEKYLNTIEHRVLHRGKADSVAFFKYMNLIARNIALDLELPPQLPFTATNKRGIPKVLKPLESLLTGTVGDKQVGLTITRFYESIYLKPSTNTDAITAPYGGIDLDPFLKKFKKYLDHKLPLIYGKISSPYSDHKIINRLVGGPNGPAMLTAHYDAVSVLEDPDLRETFLQYSKINPS
jgi:hypothetical protein